MTRPKISDEVPVVVAPNPAARVRFAFEGGDLTPLIAQALETISVKLDPAALMDLGVLYQLVGQPEDAMVCQQAALRQQRLYRHDRIGAGGGPADPNPRPLRLLALVCAGDLMTNTPLDLMLEGCGVEVTKLYVGAGGPMPDALPDHDLAMIAVSESDQTRPLLAQLVGLGTLWPRPMINPADRIAALSRDRLYKELAGAPGIVIPPTLRATREALVAMLVKEQGPETVLGAGATWPIIVRPVGSHAGRGLEKLDDPAALIAYLSEQPAPALYVSPYVDYAGADGRFRKYRIALFDGAPYLAHLAVGDHWMVHYLNADMAGDAGKRREEQGAMESFDADFARRHADAFRALHQRLGLEYFAIDCAELADGSILVFEADVGMIVHDLDPPDLYPYKKPQMRKLFDAFEALLRSRTEAGVNQS
ncbi:MAG TPA: hypothetical protein VL358_06940 [Caulobacteraceae bacterium]|jgi:hypothetical protein|nr:hypothetical protein [Caulobacteraceae bacterium]